MHRCFRPIILLVPFVLFVSAAAPAQEVGAVIDLEDGDGDYDWPFGMKLTADGTILYAAIPGSFSYPNDRVVTIDTFTDAVVLDGQAGSFPEEIEFRYSGTGALEKVFVSNSNDGTISVLNPDLSPSNIVDLTQLGGGLGNYPFGLLMGSQGRYLYVSTVNMGEIIRIDTEPGPTYLDIDDVYLNVAAFNGRMAHYNGKLVIPGTDWSFQAVLSVLDLSNPAQIDTVVLDNNPSGWPGANDVVVFDGYAYVTVLDYNGNNLLYEVDLDQSPPVLARTIDLSQTAALFEYGIGASSDGNTLVVTSLEGSVVVVGRKTGCVLAVINLLYHGAGQGNEALFSKDGKKVYITDQADTSIYVLTGVPEHGLYLTGDETALPGGTVNMILTGGETGAEGGLVGSFNMGPIVFPNFTLDIGFPFWLPVRDVFDVDHSLLNSNPTIPNLPWLAGKTIYLQGVAKDYDLEVRTSNVHELLIL